MSEDSILDDFERENAIEFREYKNVRAEREAQKRMPRDGDE